MKEEKKDKRPVDYPHPSEKDKQLRNHPEFIDEQPNDFHDKRISDLPAKDEIVRKNDEPPE